VTTSTNYDEVAKLLARMPGVKHAVALIEGQAMASTPQQAVAGFVRGVREEGLKALPLVANNVPFRAAWDNFDRQEGIAIGTRLANLLRVTVGDPVTLVARGGGHALRHGARVKPYKVAAIFEMGMSGYDRTMIFMPLVEAQRYFNKGDTVDVLEVLIDDPEKAAEQVAAMKQAGIPSLHFADWRQRNETSSPCSRSSAT